MACLPKSKAPPLTFERASEVLSYCPTTGHLRWRKSRAGCAGGEKAGTLASGYLQIQVYLVFYRAHRLAWLLAYGAWPEKALDHINGVRHDNRLANLREATPQENARNRSPESKNQSGRTGVYRTASGKWSAGIGHDGKTNYLGCFECFPDAIAARCEAEKHYFGDFARQVSEGRSNG